MFKVLLYQLIIFINENITYKLIFKKLKLELVAMALFKKKKKKGQKHQFLINFTTLSMSNPESANWEKKNTRSFFCHNFTAFPNSSIVFVARTRMSTNALYDARRNLASTASKCLCYTWIKERETN